MYRDWPMLYAIPAQRILFPTTTDRRTLLSSDDGPETRSRKCEMKMLQERYRIKVSEVRLERYIIPATCGFSALITPLELFVDSDSEVKAEDGISHAADEAIYT